MAAKKIDLKALLESKVGGIEPPKGAETAIERAERAIPRNLMYDAESTEFKPVTEPVEGAVARGLTVEEAKKIEDEMGRFIEAVLIPGVDYGTIPHCKKPSLLKPGAEKIISYLGLIARAEVTSRTEDYGTGFFCYGVKVCLLDYNGVVRAEGLGICNTKESKYEKSSGFAVQNTVLKMAKKRALVDAALNVGNLSARFTQDMEDLAAGAEQAGGGRQEAAQKAPAGNPEAGKPKASPDRPATQKQLLLLERLMQESNSSANALNRFVQRVYGIDDYRKVSSVMASELIEKFKGAARQ